MNSPTLSVFLSVFALSLMLVGCAELLPRTSTTQSNAMGPKADRSNLLLPLRHNEHYGVIRYGNGEVLFRDLTKPHPSMAEPGIAYKEQPDPAALTSPFPEDHDSQYVGIASWNPPLETEIDSAIERQASLDAPERGPEMLPVPGSEATHKSGGIEMIDPAKHLDTAGVDDRPGDGCRGEVGYVRVADEIWLARQKADHWTIQIVSAADATEPCIEDELLTEINATDARRFSVYFNDALWNVAVVGEYGTSEEALAASSQFEAPWVREIGEFRARRCNSVAYMPEELKTTLARWCVPAPTPALRERSPTETPDSVVQPIVASPPVHNESPFQQ